MVTYGYSKKIHYFWAGKNISEKNLRNIITTKYANPGFEVNIWGENNVNPLISSTLREKKFKYNDTEFEVNAWERDNANPLINNTLREKKIKYNDTEFEVNIWGKNNVNSLINNTLREKKFKYNDAEFDIGEIPINFNYKNVKTAFNFLIQQAHQINSSPELMLNCISYFCQRKKRNDNTRRYGNYVDLIHFLQHIYQINLNGVYHNYACSSDLARLAILYMEGGIYLDVDVELIEKDIKKIYDRGTATFADLRLKSRSNLGFGDCTGQGWTSDTPYQAFGNAIIAALPQSKDIFKLLLNIAVSMKKYHLCFQIQASPQAKEIYRIQHANVDVAIDKRIDLALKLNNANKMNLDTRCGIQDLYWRTGIDPYAPPDSESEQQAIIRSNERVKYTSQTTGPAFLDRHFNPKRKPLFPKKYTLQSKNKSDSIFNPVNDTGDWSDIINRKTPYEDPFP